MSKILIILLLIIVVVFNVFAFFLGTLRRLLGFAPKKRKTIFERVFAARGEQFAAGQRRGDGEIIYKNNEVTVLRGEARRNDEQR